MEMPAEQKASPKPGIYHVADTGLQLGVLHPKDRGFLKWSWVICVPGSGQGFKGLGDSWMSPQGQLYHVQGLKDQEYQKTECESGKIIIHIQTKKEHLCCAFCKSVDDECFNL